jgi:hypothetical protein
MVAAFIPFVGFFSFLLGPAGLICGIIGLVLTDRPRRQALWGTILSGVSMIVAFIMIFVYTFGFIFAVGGAVEESTRDRPTTTETAEASPAPIEILPLGTVVELADSVGAPAYESTVTASVLDAYDQVLGNARNVEAPIGMQWAMARLTVTALSAEHATVASDITVEYVSLDGHSFSAGDEYVIAPEPEFATLPDLGVGQTTTGNVVIAIPSEYPADGLWALSYTYGDSDAEPVYFEVA